jgi:predicted metal-dependent hydrolase
MLEHSRRNPHYNGMAKASRLERLAIPVEVEYKNVKTLRLTVYPPDGRVKIAAPPGTTPEIIKKFAASKIEWIEKHREKILNHSKTNVSLHDHSTVYVWGAAYELEIIERRGNPKILIDSGYMRMYVRPNSTKAQKQEFLDKWYRRILKEAAPAIIKKWEERMGLEVKKLFVRKMKSHWGSCNNVKQTLRLNSELVKRKAECLEYVIVHEMLHIIEKGHNRKFYRLLNGYMPGWKTIRKEMNAGL